MAPPLGGLTDRRRHRGRLQPVQRGLQALIVPQRRPAPGEIEDLIGCGRHQPRGAQACIARFDDLARRPDQDVGIPDRGHAVVGHGLDPDRDIARNEIDGADARRLGEGEEGIGHEILRITWGELPRQRPKEVELAALGGAAGRRGHKEPERPSARRARWHSVRRRRQALGRQDLAARIGGRGDRAARDPGRQVIDRIDDAPTELVIGGASSVGAVLFQCTRRQAEERGRLFGAQVAWRQNGEIGSHVWGLRGSVEGRRQRTACPAQAGEEGPERGMRKVGGGSILPPMGASPRRLRFITCR